MRKMKIIVSLFLVLNILFMQSVCAESQPSESLYNDNQLTTMIDWYQCTDDVIKEGDTVSFTMKLFDPNLPKDESIIDSNISLKGNSFSNEDKNNKIIDNSITYEPLIKGGQILLQLDNVLYTGNGHSIKVGYHLQTDKNTYDGSASIAIKETMRFICQNTQDSFDRTADEKIVDDTAVYRCDDYSVDWVPEGAMLGADQRVLDAQKWLNDTYGGKDGYTRIPEDGRPGVIVSQALVTAVQIELGVSE